MQPPAAEPDAPSPGAAAAGAAAAAPPGAKRPALDGAAGPAKKRGVTSSSVLERRGMKVLTATTGHEAISLVESNPKIAVVLMDIMMPQMDGYQTIGAIRQNPAFARLPIIALTAKAMKGDREKCLEAGASDYLAKPVNTEQLLLAIRMWLHR